jgi:hypothetical protein
MVTLVQNEEAFGEGDFARVWLAAPPSIKRQRGEPVPSA